jgi:hypothetical protein
LHEIKQAPPAVMRRGGKRGITMKITVKNGEEILISREDAVSVVDKGGAYEVFYADETGQLVYKGEGVEIILA